MNHLICTTALKSDVGRQRRLNEDAADVFPLAGADAAWVVCDGMGGLRAGDVASREAVQVVRDFLQASLGRDVETAPLPLLEQALKRANDAVNALGGEASDGNDAPTEPGETTAKSGSTQPVMGTTCVAGLVRDDTLYLAHAGDSRAYLWRRGHLTRLTEDHSFVAERVRAGDMTEAEAKVSRFRNIVTRAIGIDQAVEPETFSQPLEAGDQLLICSDGLTTVLEDAEIVQLMNRPVHLKGSPERLCAALVEAANSKGGPDNITALIVRLEDAVGVPTADRTRRASAPQSRVLDMDAPRPRPGKGAPVAFLLLGLLSGVLLAGTLLAFVPGLRAFVGATEPRTRPTTVPESLPKTLPTTDATPTGADVDFGKLVYNPPKAFTTRIALGGFLSYSPGAGLYFVDGGTGKVAVLSRTGVALKSVDKLPIPDISASLPTDFDIHMTSDPQGNVYLSYAKQQIVTKVAPDGKLLLTVRGFEKPEAVAIDDKGNLYVVDFNTIKICTARLPVGTGVPAPGAPKTSPIPGPKPKPTLGAG